jgi:hypothetical protein
MPRGAAGMGGGAGAQPAAPAIPQVGKPDDRSLMVGVTFLGEGDSDELIETAQDEGIDALALFDVDIDINVRNGVLTNKTRIVIYDVAADQVIARSPLLNNVKIQLRRSDPRYADEDPVNDALDDLFEDLIDKESESCLVVADEMPEGLLPEHVKGRVNSLVGGEQLNRLPMLAEIKMWHERGLLDDEAFTQAFQTVLGEMEGAKLAEGKPSERRSVVEQLIPEAANRREDEDEE